LLWTPLDEKVRRNLVAAMKLARITKPPSNNGLLFAATIEAFLAMAGEPCLCSVAFLPLGLKGDDEFWASSAMPFTGQRVWSGQDLPIGHAI
jgi:hypothetical protein